MFVGSCKKNVLIFSSDREKIERSCQKNSKQSTGARNPLVLPFPVTRFSLSHCPIHHFTLANKIHKMVPTTRLSKEVFA